MDNNNFIWTDELVEEYGRYCVLNNTWLQWEDFKESKQPKLDYEILMCKGADVPAHDYQPSVCLGRNKQTLPCTIYSVKRLSDNEVFTIGDKTTLGIITKFGLEDAALFVNTDYSTGHRYSLNILAKEKQPLFTTTDGKDIYEGDEYWYVVDDYSEVIKLNGHPKAKNENIAQMAYSTKDAANEYVLMNKPLFSVDDITRLDFNFPYKTSVISKLKQLAKQKINGR